MEKRRYGVIPTVVLYTVVASILRPNGELRKRGFPPGHKYEGKKMNVLWKWCKENYFGDSIGSSACIRDMC